MTGDASELRGRYVEQIRRNGAALTPELAAAFATVPREAFVDGGFQRRNGTWVASGDRDFLTTVYRDDVLITKLNGRTPVSSSSQPSLMAIMLAALDVRPGQRVLEIGAGTGYNAALLAALGATVTSVDVQADVADHARASLERAGVAGVEVIHGDGYAGVIGGHFDRVIVTVGVAGLSPQWLSQLEPQQPDVPAARSGAPVGPWTAALPSPSAAALGEPMASGGLIASVEPAVSGASMADNDGGRDADGGAGGDNSGGGGLSGGRAENPGGGLSDDRAKGLGDDRGGSLGDDGGDRDGAGVGGENAGGGGWVVVAPVEHAGTHPVLVVRGRDDGTVTGTVVCPSGFMSAAGPLTADHPGAYPAPAAAGSLTTFTQVAGPRWDPPLDSPAYRDLWYAAGIWNRRATHAAVPGRDQSVLALLDQSRTGGAAIMSDGAVLAGGAQAEKYAAGAIEILDRWDAQRHPVMQAWRITFALTGDPKSPIWVPNRWELP
jgi:protein-L-isoaspartate(D-aspartate) O-methyltransferase